MNYVLFLNSVTHSVLVGNTYSSPLLTSTRFLLFVYLSLPHWLLAHTYYCHTTVHTLPGLYMPSHTHTYLYYCSYCIYLTYSVFIFILLFISYLQLFILNIITHYYHFCNCTIYFAYCNLFILFILSIS